MLRGLDLGSLLLIPCDSGDSECSGRKLWDHALHSSSGCKIHRHFFRGVSRHLCLHFSELQSDALIEAHSIQEEYEFPFQLDLLPSDRDGSFLDQLGEFFSIQGRIVDFLSLRQSFVERGEDVLAHHFEIFFFRFELRNESGLILRIEFIGFPVGHRYHSWRHGIESSSGTVRPVFAVFCDLVACDQSEDVIPRFRSPPNLTRLLIELSDFFPFLLELRAYAWEILIRHQSEGSGPVEAFVSHVWGFQYIKAAEVFEFFRVVPSFLCHLLDLLFRHSGYPHYIAINHLDILEPCKDLIQLVGVGYSIDLMSESFAAFPAVGHYIFDKPRFRLQKIVLIESFPHLLECVELLAFIDRQPFCECSAVLVYITVVEFFGLFDLYRIKVPHFGRFDLRPESLRIVLRKLRNRCLIQDGSCSSEAEGSVRGALLCNRSCPN